MENTSITELYRQRKEYRQKLTELNMQIAEYQTNRLAKRLEVNRAELKLVNKEFNSIFRQDPFLSRLLFTHINNYSFLISRGMVNRLKQLGLYYVWQIVIRPESFYQQSMGTRLAHELKQNLAERGLYFGMRFG